MVFVLAHTEKLLIRHFTSGSNFFSTIFCQTLAVICVEVSKEINQAFPKPILKLLLIFLFSSASSHSIISLLADFNNSAVRSERMTGKLIKAPHCGNKQQ